MNPCDTCAFRPGSVTHDREPQNSLRGELCALGAIPFYCHHGRDGQVRDLGSPPMKARARRVLVQAGETVICQGWRRAVAELAATGYFKDSPRVKRAYAELGLGALQIFITEEKGPKKRMASRVLKDVILELNRAQGFAEVVGEGA
jgi:hypothetical protein